MKSIMTAMAASAILAGLVAPAGAQTISAEELARRAALELNRYAKIRRVVPRQIEYDADKLPVGTGIWWQQMDREGRGGRR